MHVHHFTDRDGHNAIASQRDWVFKAGRQRADHLPFGAYFTPLWLNAPLFFQRTRIPNDKRAFHLSFHDVGDLSPLQGDRGRYVKYSTTDYRVPRIGRLRMHGPADDAPPPIPVVEPDEVEGS